MPTHEPLGSEEYQDCISFYNIHIPNNFYKRHFVMQMQELEILCTIGLTVGRTAGHEVWNNYLDVINYLTFWYIRPPKCANHGANTPRISLGTISGKSWTCYQLPFFKLMNCWKINKIHWKIIKRPESHFILGSTIKKAKM